ncbi:MAG: peptide deformylase [Nitrospirae bacterium]|nr:peptide deformylase [Nitrospirota bacterium]
MALLEIKKYPDNILKEKTVLIDDIDGELQHLIDNMTETMYSVRGIGLAANQVGIPKRLCVVDTSIRDEKGSLIVLINPIIISKEGKEEAEEGCLSLPGYLQTIKRSAKIFLKALNREGKPMEIEATGLLARVFQHEIDHLDGLLIIDRISPIKREFFKRRYKKSLREAVFNFKP